MKYLLFLIVLAAGFVSCKKDSNLPNQASTKAYPSKLQDNWVYRLTEPNGHISIVNVEVVARRVLPNGDSASVLKYAYSPSGVIDTEWVYTSPTVVRIYGNVSFSMPNQMPYQKIEYRLPITSGQMYLNDNMVGDTIRTTGTNSVTVPAGTFTGCATIRNTRWFPDAGKDDTIYLKDSIGLVKMVRNHSDFVILPQTGNGTWELLSYHLH